MSKIDIQLGDVSMTEHNHETPVRIALKPQPVPPQWEGLLFTKWLEAQRKSGKYPDMTVVNGVVTVACRWEDYRQFFHEEVEQKVAETNELYNRQAEEAALRLAEEEKAALLRADSDREASRQRLKEVAAFNELRRLRSGDLVKEPEMASRGS